MSVVQLSVPEESVNRVETSEQASPWNAHTSAPVSFVDPPEKLAVGMYVPAVLFRSRAVPDTSGNSEERTPVGGLACNCCTLVPPPNWVKMMAPASVLRPQIRMRP